MTLVTLAILNATTAINFTVIMASNSTWVGLAVYIQLYEGLDGGQVFTIH